jgi:hypothetical protein
MGGDSIPNELENVGLSDGLDETSVKLGGATLNLR